MPFKKFWNLAPDTNNEDTLNMYVYGEICSASSFFGSEDDVVASNFVEDLNSYPGVKNINVYINSPGGSVFSAAAIINQLRKHPACVDTWCDGICASAAVGILMAADPGHRHMSKASLLMIHNPSTRASGDQAVFLKTADLLAKVKTTILNIYQEGTGLSKEQLSKMMDDETYLDAEEALQYNFIDKITEDTVSYDFRNEGIVVCNGISMDVAAELDIQKFKNHLSKLADTAKTKSEGGNPVMSFEEFMATLTDEQKELVTNEITSHVAAKVTEMQSSNEAALDALKEQCSALEAQLQQVKDTQTPDVPTDEEALLNDVSDEVKNLLAQARADAIAAQQALAKMKEEKEFTDFKESFASLTHLPIKDEHIKAMQSLAKSDETMYNELREILRVADTAMSAGFVPVGTDQGDDVATDAIDIMEQRIKEYQVANSGASYATALQAVLREDPDLYDAYRQGFSVE